MGGVADVRWQTYFGTEYHYRTMRLKTGAAWLEETITPFDLYFAVVAGVSGVAGSYALAGYTRQFIVAPIDALVVRLTPGAIIAFVIQDIGEQGHLLHIALSFAVAVGLLAAAATLGLVVARRVDRPPIGGIVGGVVAWSLTAVITFEPALSLGAGGPVLVFTTIGATQISAADHDKSRRRVLVSGAGAFGFTGLSFAVGRLWSGGDAGSDDIDPEVATLMEDAAATSLDISSDIPGLVSSIAEFYNVDIAQFDPNLSADDWSMAITGAVGTDVTVSFEELKERPTEHRFVTLRCVGEAINGQKMDTAVWTGTPIKPLLEEVDPGGECACAMLRAEDGYFVQFPMEALEDGFLAWGMNGQPLPKSHGHPVRVLIPGHWGETNLKWLDEIELLDEEMDGYWEQRGWHGTGPVNTVAKLWGSTVLDNGNVEVAGHAYAGTREIDRVELSFDGGATWEAVELSEPLPGEDVWRQWRHEFEPEGSHEITVRAIDGTGTVQPEKQTRSSPSGATGWVTKTVEE